jgi:hypothetical protein
LKHLLTAPPAARTAVMCDNRPYPPPVMRDNHGYRRQYPLLTLAASAVLSGVRRQKEC